ncbi:hypothetical protein CU254_14800 [Amycolatopsis sp. AA4]|uniref:hypothetical protein n=1 Tax=Actinomycetes TaxID=1760 RepID=UPI0001B5501A|nr:MULTISPECIES: hypothetical protein [Actinomycetes]ATY11587.1 hypothetical protein CU254_14800 [Amycolatopsis sp. AA4]
MPEQPENASERPSQPGGTASFGEIVRALTDGFNAASIELGSELRQLLRGMGLVGPDLSASERPNAGAETARRDEGRHTARYSPDEATYDERRAYSHGYTNGLDAGSELPYDHPLLETQRQDWEAESDVRQRAASWWEAAKTYNRAWKGRKALDESREWLHRETQRQCDAVQLHLGPLYNDDHHSWSVETLAQKAAADITSGVKRETSIDSGSLGAMARIIVRAGEVERELKAERACAEAAEAQLSEMNRMIGEANDRALRALRGRDESEDQLTQAHNTLRERTIERDEARAKLDQVRAVLARWDSTTVAVDLLDEIADAVASPAPVTDREEPAREVDPLDEVARVIGDVTGLGVTKEAWDHLADTDASGIARALAAAGLLARIEYREAPSPWDSVADSYRISEDHEEPAGETKPDAEADR